MLKKVSIAVLSLFFASCGEYHAEDFASQIESQSFEGQLSQAATAAYAFPGALGFGRIATGGRGGTVLKVTNLSDDINTKGSFRWALAQTYPRIIIFTRGGIIKASKSLEVKNGNLTIAGQTAPGKGIAIRGSRLVIKASNVIVRGLKFRVGDVKSDGPASEIENRDGISIGDGNKYIDRIIIDSNSIAWSVDESLTGWGNLKDITFSNNLIGEALRNSIHPKGRHSMALLIGQKPDAGYTFPRRVTLIRNMLGNSMFRCPLMKGVTNIEVINSYCFNFQKGNEMDNPNIAHLIKNLYEQGTDSSTSVRPIDGLGGATKVYLRGNRDLKFRTTDSKVESAIAGGDLSRISSTPLFTSLVSNEISVDNLKNYLLNNTGARWPVRDETDERILSSFKNRDSKLIDSQSQVGGWETYPAGTTPKDTDGDGMPDSFEKARGLKVNVKDDNAYTLGGGYTNIEHYINGIIAGTVAPN